MTNKPKYTCECGFTAKTPAGLSAHQRYCKTITQGTKQLTPKEHAIVKAKRDNPTLNHSEIGKLVDCDRSHVSRVLQKYGINHKDLQAFKTNRADIFAGLQDRILNTITLDDIKKTSVAQKVTAVAILNDKERLERGQSTANVMNIHADLQAIKDKAARGGGSNVPGAEAIIDGE